MLTLTVGFALCLAAHLLLGAALKLRRLYDLQMTLVRVLPGYVWRRDIDSRRVARALVAIELFVGVGLTLVGTTYFAPAGYLALGLFACFVVISFRAYRRQISCGCFGVTKSIAGRADIGRTVILCLMACFIVVGNVKGRPTGINASSLLIAFGAASLAWTPVIIARSVSYARLSAGQFGHARSGPVATPRLSDPAMARTRRSFMAEAISITAAVCGMSSIGAVPAAQGAVPQDVVPDTASCMGLYKTCIECCNPIETCADCCDDCYISCIEKKYACHGGDYCYNLNSGDFCWD